MGSDLFRVESAVTAESCGNLTWDLWPHDAITALGLAGVRNPIGFALVRYMSEQTSAAVWGVVLALSKVMIERGIEKDDAGEISFTAFEAWNNRRCLKCAGRGSLDTGHQCPACAGTGQRPLATNNKSVSDAISVLIEAEQWMEGQLASRLKRDR